MEFEKPSHQRLSRPKPVYSTSTNASFSTHNLQITKIIRDERLDDDDNGDGEMSHVCQRLYSELLRVLAINYLGQDRRRRHSRQY